MDSTGKSRDILQSTLEGVVPMRQQARCAQQGLLLIALLFCTSLHANPILTEIHYNGPGSGSDPDEFIELSNPDSVEIDLEGWYFTDGISFTFGEGATLDGESSLVIAKNPREFSATFPGYIGTILDFSGALSNSGETIALASAAGTQVWAVDYDDSAPWPAEADGLGSSLQRIFGAFDSEAASNWLARPPTPGVWKPSATRPTSVPVPTVVGLLGIGALLLSLRMRPPPREPTP